MGKKRKNKNLNTKKTPLKSSILESEKFLSESILWTKLRDYYLNMGIEAWQTGAVPSFITSNVFIGRAYAKLILAYIQDHKNNHPHENDDQPYYIVEVGAGHGKLGFYVVKALLELCSEENIKPDFFKYVMTDIAQRNIDYWLSHSALKPLFEKGVMDCAVFDADNESEIRLINSNLTLSPGTANKPISMLGNYILDTLPHDSFEVRDHKLHTALINTKLVHPENVEIKDSNILNYMKHSFSSVPCSYDVYDDEVLNKIIDGYAKEFEEASFLIPINGIKCINKIKALSSSDFILITADKGDANYEVFEGIEPPFIEADDYAALMVNFDALNKYFRYNNGFSLQMQEKSSSFQVVAASFADITKYPLLTKCYKEYVQNFGPNDFFNIEDSLPEDYKKINLTLVMALLKLSHWDPHVFYKYKDIIVDSASSLEDEEKDDLADQVYKVWDNFFFLEDEDLPFEIGRLLYTLDYSEKAIEYYRHSLKFFGEEICVLYNLGLCYFEVGDFTNSLKYFELVTNQDPNYDDVKEWKAKSKKEINKQRLTHNEEEGLTVKA